LLLYSLCTYETIILTIEMSTKLTRSFFNQPTLDVAKSLLGKQLVFNHFCGIITETEAYIGKDDPACHAAKGKTKRTEVMFGQAGYAYVYFIYGMYHCLNIVTEEEGFPAAVLIRGLLLTSPKSFHLDGPGKLCRELDITKAHNRLDLIHSPSFYLEETHLSPVFDSTPRIGITMGKEKLWRFVIQDPLSYIGNK